MFQIELLKDYFVIFVKNQNKSSFFEKYRSFYDP